MKIKFYRHKYHKLEPKEVFLVDWSEDLGNRDYLMSYCPIGQHSEALKDYVLNDCVEITKEQYIKASLGVYTPPLYLK